MKHCFNCMYYKPYRSIINNRLGFCMKYDDKVAYVEGDKVCDEWKDYNCREAKYNRYVINFFEDWDFAKRGDITPEMLQRAEEAFNSLSEEEMKCL